MWDIFRLKSINIKHQRRETFQEQVLNSFLCEKHSLTPEDERFICANYRHGPHCTRGTRLGVMCESMDQGIKRLQVAFAEGCRTPVEIVFPC